MKEKKKPNLFLIAIIVVIAMVILMFGIIFVRETKIIQGQAILSKQLVSLEDKGGISMSGSCMTDCVWLGNFCDYFDWNELKCDCVQTGV
jgi:hypothetical protein